MKKGDGFYQVGLHIACCQSTVAYEDEPKLAGVIAKAIRTAVKEAKTEMRARCAHHVRMNSPERLKIVLADEVLALPLAKGSE